MRPKAAPPSKKPQPGASTISKGPKTVADEIKEKGRGKKASDAVKDASNIVVEHAPAVLTSPKTSFIKVPAALSSQAYVDLCAEIDKVEHSTSISTTSLSSQGYVKNAVSSGCLMYDFVSGGGIAPGRFTIIPGREGSGKSTLTNFVASTCVLQGVPIYWFDAETALSPDYASKIFGKFGLRFSDLLGARDPKNFKKWLIPPVIRYSDDAVGEHVFKTMRGIMQLLPTLRQDAEGNWWKLIVTKTKKEWVEDPTGGRPQFLFILDSCPALLPESIDENPDKSPMAVQARMFSDNLKLVKSLLSQKNCILLATNQLRLNPGARMCLHGTTKVTLVDGREMTIKEIVEKKIKAKVWSLNEKTGKIEPKRITGWYNNGKVSKPEDWIRFKTSAVNTPNGFCGFTVTNDHKILTQRGWIKAEDATLQDKMITRCERTINGTLREFLAGTSIGDLSITTSANTSGGIGICNNEQPEYAAWKLQKLGKHFNFKEHASGTYGVKGKVAATQHFKSFVSESSHELLEWKKIIGKRSAMNIKDDWFTALSLAVWFMDDGHCNLHKYPGACISAKRFKGNEQELSRMAELIAKFGINVKVSLSNGHLVFYTAEAKKLFNVIAKYIPPCMQYKLPEEWRGKYKDFELKATKESVTTEVSILEIDRGNKRRFGMKTKYDITVEDNHNYMVGNIRNGVIVHNSDPVYEPCGEALKFYSDNRTRIMRISPNTAGVPSGSGAKFSEEPGLFGGVDQYVYSKIQNTKNKAFAPYRESMFRIRFLKDGAPGDGICETWDCASFFQATGQMLQRGNTMTLNVRPTAEKGKQLIGFSEGQRISRQDFKNLVENPKYKRAIFMHCLRQIRSGYAFQLEREATSRLIAAGGEERAMLGTDDGIEA
jgi:RecA/RadA recombinase